MYSEIHINYALFDLVKNVFFFFAMVCAQRYLPAVKRFRMPGSSE